MIRIALRHGDRETTGAGEHHKKHSNRNATAHSRASVPRAGACRISALYGFGLGVGCDLTGRAAVCIVDAASTEVSDAEIAVNGATPLAMLRDTSRP